MNWLQRHMAVICIAVGAIFTLFVLVSWSIGYYANALYGYKFDLGSCWAGLSAIAISLVGILKWLMDSSKNSVQGDLPEGYSQKSQIPGEIKDSK